MLNQQRKRQVSNTSFILIAMNDNDDLKVIDYDAKQLSSSSSVKRMKVLTIRKTDLREGI